MNEQLRQQLQSLTTIMSYNDTQSQIRLLRNENRRLAEKLTQLEMQAHKIRALKKANVKMRSRLCKQFGFESNNVIDLVERR